MSDRYNRMISKIIRSLPMHMQDGACTPGSNIYCLVESFALAFSQELDALAAEYSRRETGKVISGPSAPGEFRPGDRPSNLKEGSRTWGPQ